MIDYPEADFTELVQQAVSAIPRRYADHLNNVAFLVADMPSPQQLQAGGILHGGMTLLGLYEGVPLPRRSAGYSGVAPDVITVFRQPHLMMVHSEDELRVSVKQTVWHEVAHYFGLDHGQIRELEAR